MKAALPRRVRDGYANTMTAPLLDSQLATSAITIDGLTKVYKGGKRALDAVSLNIPRGTIFGLLGPNGAGKSTLINILAGIVGKTSGSATVWGHDIAEDPRNAKLSIGVVPQEIMFDPFFTPRETLENQAGFYGVPKSARITDELLRAVRLEDKADAYARTLSGGMKRRLMVAKAMVHSPPIIVLDEPTAGVDIELRQMLWDYVRQLNANGATVVLTTHYLEEAEALCDRIAIINHGRVIADKPTRELVAMGRDKTVVLTLGQDIDVLPDNRHFDKVERLGDRQLAISFDMDKITAGEILTAVQAGHYDIVDVSTREADLEDIFLKLTRAET